MPTSLLAALPYMPALQPVDALSLHHMKYVLDDLVGPGELCQSQNFPGSLSACRLMGGGVMLMAELPHGTVVRHDWQHVAQLESDDVLASIVLEGSGCVEQNGVALQFASGDVFYRKARIPSTVRNDSACRFLLLRFSFSRFHGAHTSRFQHFVPTMARRDSALRQAVWHYAQQVLPSLPQLAGQSADTAYHAEQAFVSMLSAAYSESQQPLAPPIAPAPDDTRWNLLAATFDALLCEPDLTVAQVARTMGISPRLLHRLFERRGLRYGSYLLERRLERAHAELGNPRHARLSVADIAYRCGFNNASHFSRAFRQRYGLSPSAVRQAGAA
ncbi:AraC family transcriptional regulator [Herbaspirillum sp. alder98]|uniref:AraC family transcriptional regulator n=1 Tax=Herbaspirillum sp. alder98 TaxID=2913096 RepID=UPI001CD91575|nr:AraC family transcriptional regulator [Herbaspirillum sp. alder98]MCA1323156.1 AraC family transcriptional regulator [Herbaspirillum sp. alder98]